VKLPRDIAHPLTISRTLNRTRRPVHRLITPTSPESGAEEAARNERIIQSDRPTPFVRHRAVSVRSCPIFLSVGLRKKFFKKFEQLAFTTVRPLRKTRLRVSGILEYWGITLKRFGGTTAPFLGERPLFAHLRGEKLCFFRS